MKKRTNNYATLDGNEAAAYVAYRTNEICIIYPITPASSMGELADQWSAQRKQNIWHTVPQVITMQSEGGAAGAMHGALQTGALVTTFTSSQGLLLMMPNMFRIAGELLPTVFHVATRTLAFQGMSIYGDHSDVYATRSTGFAMLSSANVQETHDMALVAQVASLKSRVPFLHFFDGFRTSHEVAKIELLTDEHIRSMVDDNLLLALRSRRLSPNNPTARGVVADSDIYFQGREAINGYYDRLPKILEESLREFYELTGREYSLIEYHGDPHAERIIVAMGSATDTIEECIDYLVTKNEKIGLVKIRLFRPFPKQHFLAALPHSCRSIAVLDRAKEIGAAGEPLYTEVATTILENQGNINNIKLIGGRFGIASKEFTPAMVMGIFNELKNTSPKNHFTIGINDDVTHSSLPYDANLTLINNEAYEAIFYGLGSDGTVSANKNSIKIIGEETNLYAQGYFIYDAKKTGSKTISHLRFSKNKIRAPYLIRKANFIGIHQFNFIEKIPLEENAACEATMLLNSSLEADKIWDRLPRPLQETIIAKKIKLYAIDAYEIAHSAGMKNHINTIMQTCFFALSKLMASNQAITKIKEFIKKSYGSKGEVVVQKNYLAVDNALANLHKISIPAKATGTLNLTPAVTSEAPDFVKNILGKMLAGKGNELPVSALPSDGTYLTNTTRWEKRGIALETPRWIAENCLQCGLCSLACPHSAIRAKSYAKNHLKHAPQNFPHASLETSNHKKDQACYTLQIYGEDCTGCGACIDICPCSKTPKVALAMHPKAENPAESLAFFNDLPQLPREEEKLSPRSMQHRPPMFEFCGACSGCGETPYIKLLTQLIGDRLIIADACGCTLAYGGNLPTIPWTTNGEGRGPAFGASLFEDNAEFGYGFLLTVEKHREQARELLKKLAKKIARKELVNKILRNEQKTALEIASQREDIHQLKKCLHKINARESKLLLSLIDHLARQSIWILGGDGWAYDIGYGGLDHVLASGKNVKVLVLDTEVYSNTGGQASKATPRGAVVKFAAGGKSSAKKDLGLMFMSYGNVYIASIALGANPSQAIKSFHEAENYDGPAIIIAYSHCITHGIEMHRGMQQQKLAVNCGYWPLYRFNPERTKMGLNPLQLDYENPSIPFNEYIKNENRYRILMRDNPTMAEQLINAAQEDIARRLRIYKTLATMQIIDS